MNRVCVCVCVCVLYFFFLFLDIIKGKSLFKQIHCTSVAQLFTEVSTAQLVSVCTSVCSISVCVHTL